MIINYCKSGIAYPDYLCEDAILHFWKDGEHTVNTSNACMIDAARMLIAEGKIP